MKRQNISGLFSFDGLLSTPIFLFLTALLLCGAAVGAFGGLLCSSETLGQAMLDETGGELLRLCTQSLWVSLGWLGAVLLGGRVLGGLPVFVLTAAKGFALAFAVVELGWKGGTSGVLLSILTGGVAAVITTPSLLVAAAAAAHAASDSRLEQAGYFALLWGRYRRSIVAATLLTLCAVPVRLAAAGAASLLFAA